MAGMELRQPGDDGVERVRLTDKEMAVLELLNAGLRPKQIVPALYAAEATVRKRIDSINGKFGTNSYFASLILARTQGLVEKPLD